MAVKLVTKAPNTIQIIEKLFPAQAGGTQHPAVGLAKHLMANKVTVMFGLLQFMVRFDLENVFATQLPVMSTAILDGKATQEQLQSIAVQVEKILHAAMDYASKKLEMTETYQEPETAPVETPTPTALKGGKPMTFVKDTPPKEVAASKWAKEDVTPSATPVNATIKLAEAKALGQKVSGTSPGSTYRAVAISPKVNVAARPTPSQVSLRAECPGGKFPADLKKRFTSVGFSDNGVYVSIHVSVGAVPVMRVVGALLFSLGIPFQALATTEEQLSV